jgi:quercetin dioxygenase-like cupin family protein
MSPLHRIASRVTLAALSTLAFPLATLGAQTSPVALEHEAKHHLVLSNDYVRLYNVIVPAGDSTLYHKHPDDYAFITFGGVRLKSQMLGGKKSDLVIGDGEVRFTKAPIAHRVLNPSNTEFHNLSIDIMKSNGVPLANPPGGTVVLDNAKLRVVRITLEPGQSSIKHVHTGPGLDVAVHPAQFDVIGPNGAVEHKTMPTAGYEWNAGARTHTIKNTGKSRLEIVEFEWK